MSNPFWIEGPALLSFSGGRTSGMMLARIVEAHGGTLPDNIKVAFANTGKERPETLDFVQRCAEHFGVHIQWIEYDRSAAHHTALVNHNSASRLGEPFSAVIAAKSFLPNPVMRFCTIEMKIRRFDKYCRHILGWDRWTSVVGLRADEKRRVDKQVRRNLLKKDRWQTVMPLAAAGLSKWDVKTFWDAMPFDLALENVNGSTPEGNCDLCFLKSAATLRGIMRKHPSAADWWIDAESRAPGAAKLTNKEMALFRADRPRYAVLRDASAIDLFNDEEETDCACTD